MIGMMKIKVNAMIEGERVRQYLYITKEDKEKRRTRKVITDAIAEHDPDMILFNNPWWGNMMMSFNVPLIERYNGVYYQF